MSEELIHDGIYGGNWWNSPRNLFRSSPCNSSAINDIGSFGWLQSHDLLTDMKTATSISDDSAGSASDGSSSVLRHDVQKPQQQMMGINTQDWNQDLLHDGGRSEENYSHMLQASAGLNSGTNYHQKTSEDCPQTDKNWSCPRIFFEDNSFKQQVINKSFPLEQQQRFTNLPLNSASYGYSSSLLQTLFDSTDSQPQQSLLDNQAIGYSSSPNYGMNSTEISPSPGLTKDSYMVKPFLPKQQVANHLHFTNNTSFWNANAAVSDDVPASFVPSKHNLNNFSVKKHHYGKARDSDSVAKKVSNEAAFKRPRIETPSPLPTFKVRKEKMGDRITALQQLVSPFGKTDTASVLHEAIEYIKFLHDQVSVLSTPYLKNGSPPLQRQQIADKTNDEERLLKDLKSRGLCLVPISSTYPVAADTTTDFWTPTFGGSFR